jgi:acetylornithine deacetylase
MSPSLLNTTLDLLGTLVQFDTTSHQSNLELIEFVRAYLTGLGAECQLIADADRRKFNLYATIGPTDRSGLCLSGHTDVVPVDHQPWTVEPFALTRRGDRLFGRGTADMKGFLAAVLAAAPHFVPQCGEIPIHLAFSYDEQVGCRGVRSLLDRLVQSACKPLGCIVGEPTGMQVSIAHKGKLAYHCEVKGRSGHSALPQRGVNAVEIAAELVSFLCRSGRDLATGGKRDERFEPPWTTVHVGKFHGGVALNVIPEYAEFEFEIRHLPGHDPAAVVDATRTYAECELLPAIRMCERFPSAPKAVCFKRSEFRRWFAGQDRSSRHTKPTSISRWVNWSTAWSSF